MDEEKSEYYFRLCLLIVDQGTDVLCQVLEKLIPVNETVKEFLNPKSPGIKQLIEKKVLNKLQVQILNATSDIRQYDISLLYILISSLTRLKDEYNWGLEPTKSNMSHGACLKRLKVVRNEAIAHRERTVMKKSKFEEYWEMAERSLIELMTLVGDKEKDAVAMKIQEAKTGPLLEDVSGKKLEALLKWDVEDRFSKFDTKLSEIKTKLDEHGNLTEDMSSMSRSIEEIKEGLKSLGVQSMQDTSDPNQVIQSTVADCPRPGQHTEISALRAQVHSIDFTMKKFMELLATTWMIPEQNRFAGPALPDKPITNPNALSDDEITEFANELGSDWEIFAIYLGYKQNQIDMMKLSYPYQIETLLLVMVQKWHDVVARVDDENPRRLLAAAFSGIRDNLTAFHILGDRSLLKDVKKEKPKDSTLKKIRQIKFGASLTAVVNIGGNNSINTFPGARMIVQGNVGLHTPYQLSLPPMQPLSADQRYPQQQGQPQLCRGEMDQTDGGMSSNFKRMTDETLAQHAVTKLSEAMPRVGYLRTPFQVGTAFRVGERFIITAYHVLEKVTDNMYMENLPSPQESTPMVFVNFNEQLDVPSAQIYRLNPPYFFDSQLDIAVLEITNPDANLPGCLRMSKKEGPKDKVSIIGYGHPGNSSKHLDPNCPILTANSEKVIRAVDAITAQSDYLARLFNDPNVVSEAFSGFDDPSRFLLDSYFEHGGSGGPALDHTVPQFTEVVGVYVKGFPKFFFRLPAEVRETYKNEHIRFEMCTRTSSLYSVMLSSSNNNIIQLAQHIFEQI